MRKNGAKRSLVATITTLSIVALLLVSLTVAFLTDSRSTLNILGIGYDPEDPQRAVQIALLETEFGALDNANAVAALDGLAGEYEKVTLNGLMPGDKVNKDSTVKNVGQHDVYVRVQLTDENGDLIDQTAEPYSNLAFSVAPEWVYDSVTECYYYYTERGSVHNSLANGESLPVFVTSQDADGDDYTIEISTAIDNNTLETLGNTIDIKVRVDAIQVANFEPSAIDGVNDPWNGEEILEVTGRYDGN